MISESAHPITPVEPLKSFLGQFSLPHIVDNIIFGISVPDYPSRTVESKCLRLFWNFDSAYPIYFSQVLLILFTFLTDTADKEIYKIFNSFSIPLIL